MFSNDQVEAKHQKSSVLNRRYRNQLLAAITVQFISFSHGIAIGWSSPTLLKLQSNDSPTNFVVSVDQVSWIGSLFGLGSLAGDSFGLILNRIGRKWCLYLMALPYIMAWILIFFSKSYIYLYVARFLHGITDGALYLVIPIFISEIADPSIRGTLASLLGLFFSFGIMVGFIFSSHLDYYLNPCIIVIFPILYLLTISRLPETPQYLLRKQHIDKAHKSFRFYKNLPQLKTSAEQQELNVDGGFEELKQNILSIHSQADKVTFKDFVSWKSLKAFLTAFIILALSQFSGYMAFLFYMSEIFSHAGTDMNPNTCTIITGLAQIAGTCFIILTVDRFGRKLLMLVSSSGMAVGLFSFALYIQYASDELKLKYNWLPVVIMVFVILMANISVTGLLIVELFPAKIRAPANTICMCFASITIFVALKVFPLIMENYGLATLLFSCSGVAISGCLYMLMYLKETKGISMDK
ncbi:facilitated trehalose transporter Tret1-like [Calliphora vicina]|uniref:facilitated trehalose transporter Tret1-like n=1 Tax=Calliphora vicina TaxID=7373 RepID=UPI00325C067F